MRALVFLLAAIIAKPALAGHGMLNAFAGIEWLPAPGTTEAMVKPRWALQSMAARYDGSAVAGVYQGKIIFSMPGSTHAVRLAMEKLILPELAHLVWELKK